MSLGKVHEKIDRKACDLKKSDRHTYVERKPSNSKFQKHIDVHIRRGFEL